MVWSVPLPYILIPIERLVLLFRCRFDGQFLSIERAEMRSILSPFFFCAIQSVSPNIPHLFDHERHLPVPVHPHCPILLVLRPNQQSPCLFVLTIETEEDAPRILLLGVSLRRSDPHLGQRQPRCS